MRFIQLAGGLAALLFLCGNAAAFDETLTLPANQTSGFAEFSANTQDCHLIGKPIMTVPVKPAHGTITFKWVASRLGKSAGRCAGRPGHMMRAYYTPTKGYRGKDSFRIGTRYPRYEGGTETDYMAADVNVLVK